MEASRIHKDLVSQSVRSEEDRRGKNSLEGCSHSTVLSAIISKMEIVKQLSWAVKMKGAGLLPVSESGEPDRYQAILTVGQPKTRVSGDFE